MVCEADIYKRLLAGRMDLPASNSFLRINPLMEPSCRQMRDQIALHPLMADLARCEKTDLHLLMGYEECRWQIALHPLMGSKMNR
jgi:hypothetical protein